MSEPVAQMPSGIRRCQARSKQTGLQCGNPAIAGGNTCRYHGSATGAARRAAQLRLLDLVDPAIATLAREMTNAKARPGDRIRAAEAVLDRTGYPRQVAVDAEAGRELLLQRLLRLRDEALASTSELAERIVVQGAVEAGAGGDPGGGPGGGSGVAAGAAGGVGQGRDTSQEAAGADLSADQGGPAQPDAATDAGPGDGHTADRVDDDANPGGNPDANPDANLGEDHR